MRIEILPTSKERDLALAAIRGMLEKTEKELVIVIENHQNEQLDIVQWKFSGENIRLRRKELGMTQVDLANLLGYRRTGISAIEAGARDASPKMLCMLASVLRVDPQFFFERIPGAFEKQTSSKPEGYQENRKPKNRTRSTFLPGIKLRDLLDEREVNQETFAQKLSQNLDSTISGGLISSWIHGKIKPTQRQFAAIVEVLGIKPEILVGLQ